MKDVSDTIRRPERTDLEIAIDLLRQYQAYGERMREHGRGFHAVSKEGLSAAYFLSAFPEEIPPPA